MRGLAFRRVKYVLCLVVIALALGAISPRTSLALQPDELLLIVNPNVPAGVRTAEFYAKARLVPDGRICAVPMPPIDNVPAIDFEKAYVPIIREHIRKNHLESKIKCLVTFFGVPLHLSQRLGTPSDQQEIAELRRQYDETLAKMEPLTAEVESQASELDPSFHSAGGSSLEAFAERATRAMQAIASKLPPSGDPRHLELLRHLMKVNVAFGGEADVLSRFKDEDLGEIAKSMPIPDQGKWPERRAQLAKDQREMAELQEKAWEPEARKRLRELMAGGFGMYSTAALLRAQADYLRPDDIGAAFDSELALLWWNFYPHAKWLPNPLHYRFAGQSKPVMMVTRLDGPQEGTAAQIILSSMKAERDGLQGRVVVDSSGGTGPGGVADRDGGYRAFDQTMLNFANIVRDKTKLPLTLDTRSRVLAPNSAKDVALYCGWYSVRNYVPACQFKPGAVGYHVASFEMVSLRGDNEKGWCAGLLNDGIAATIGATAEPYLNAFPPPDEFFPLLMTGKVTLAEAYWATVPQTSWQLAIIGDPLYRPYAKNPQLRVEDLEPGLRKVVERVSASTQPTTHPN